MWNANYLFASLFWGSVGVGYFIYGRKQRAWPPMLGGVLMMATSYFVASLWLMSLLCLGLVLGVYAAWRQGW